MIEKSPVQISPSHFEKVCQLGTGSVGKVYLAKEKSTQRHYAIKFIKTNLSDNSEITSHVNVISSLYHMAILRPFGYSLPDHAKKRPMSIVNEYQNNGSLLTLLSKPELMTDFIRMKILFGVAKGLRFIHENRLIHGALTPGNILLTNNWEPVISDYSMGKIAPKKRKYSTRDMSFFAPEFFSSSLFSAQAIDTGGSELSSSVDVFSYGMIAYAVITKNLPFGENEKDPKTKILNGERPPLTGNIPECWQRLISQCWDKEPSKRPTFESIVLRFLKNEFFLPLKDIESIQMRNYQTNCLSSSFATKALIKTIDQIESLSDANKTLNRIVENLKRNVEVLTINMTQIQRNFKGGIGEERENVKLNINADHPNNNRPNWAAINQNRRFSTKQPIRPMIEPNPANFPKMGQNNPIKPTMIPPNLNGSGNSSVNNPPLTNTNNSNSSNQSNNISTTNLNIINNTNNSLVNNPESNQSFTGPKSNLNQNNTNDKNNVTEVFPSITAMPKPESQPKDLSPFPTYGSQKTLSKSNTDISIPNSNQTNNTNETDSKDNSNNSNTTNNNNNNTNATNTNNVNDVDNDKNKGKNDDAFPALKVSTNDLKKENQFNFKEPVPPQQIPAPIPPQQRMSLTTPPPAVVQQIPEPTSHKPRLSLQPSNKTRLSRTGKHAASPNGPKRNENSRLFASSPNLPKSVNMPPKVPTRFSKENIQHPVANNNIPQPPKPQQQQSQQEKQSAFALFHSQYISPSQQNNNNTDSSPNGGLSNNFSSNVSLNPNNNILGGSKKLSKAPNVLSKNKMSFKNLLENAQFPYAYAPFDGIFAHLTNEVKGNLVEKGIVTITGNSADRNRENSLHEIINFEWNKCWTSANVPNSYIQFDFGVHQICITHYTIKTYLCGQGYSHLKNWVVEGCNTGQWYEIDRRDDNNELNGKSRVATFQVASTGDFQMIRLRQTGPNHYGDNYLILTNIEFFGDFI
ncbi:hypothetical protein TRFO_25163 [Tritrichomonas foetus]|uniref:Protein kinase domain-containing protein n=1 Tax=Tritrichomonas foetus TaxID=1144522 RepID=A0A1J4K5M7_9EUKA|nr:hypothetical protein TRFO_25163 [Tritrichomonas foetus]|eukprot:OHT06703.1 hypothetical protein TRFO_25163 [Tritrichomonas foetus]